MLLFMMMIDSEEDRSKFQIIYETYSKLMFFLARQIVMDDRDAEDAVQEAFIKIIENLDKISDPKCPKAKHFIVVIIKRTAIDFKRKQNREPEMVAIDETTGGMYIADNTDTEYQKVDDSIDLSKAIAGLSDTYRDVILLKYYQDYTDSQIAELMGLSVSNVQKTIQRARKKLEQELSSFK